MANKDDFESLYRSHYKRLVRFLMHSFNVTEETAQDWTHDVFLRIWRSIGTYRGDATWGFLETTARRVAYNRLRGKRAKKRDAVEEAIDEIAHSLGAPSATDEVERLDRAVQLRRLRDAIDELPGVQREYLQMQLAGFSYPEIARFFRTTEDGVKSRLRDARANLKKKLGATADLLHGGEE
jgi:RNA polymerase sigma-70 factor (ECF subfamily)